MESRRAAYDIKKLRAKGMVRKIGKSRRYEPVPEGLRALTALLVLREKIIQPIARCQPPASDLSPNRATQRPSTTTTKTFEPACEISSLSLAWPPEHRQSIFHLFG